MSSNDSYWQRQAGASLSRRRLLRMGVLGGAAIAGASLLACSDDGDDKGGGSAIGAFNTGTLTGTETGDQLRERFHGKHLKDLPAQKEGPKYGGIHRRERNTPPSWDFTSAAASSLGAQGMMFFHNTPMQLEVHDLAKDLHSHNIEPALVKSWERAGQTTLVLHIDEAAKWQNVAPVNGRQFTSEDLAYVFNAYKSTPAQQFVYRDVDRIETPDSKTLRLQLKQPAAWFEQLMTTPYNVVFSREQAESSEGMARRPVGTGAYIFESAQDRVGIKMRKNPDYWRKDRNGKQLPYVDGIETFFFADITAQVAAFRDKQLDGIGAGDRTTWETVINGHPEYVSQISPAPPGYQPSIAMRLDKAPWNDVRVRRAMSLAIDRQTIVKSYGDLGHPAYSQDWSYFGRGTPWALEDLGPWSKFDPQQAKQLMTAAGFTNGMGRKVPLALAGSTGPQNYDIPFLVSDSWRKHLGLETDLKIAQDSATWNRTFYGKQYEDLAAPGFLTLGFEPDEMSYGLLHSKAPSNFTFVDDTTLDDLVVRQGNELNRTERQKLLKQIMDRDLDQQFRIFSVALNLIQVRHPHVFSYVGSLYGGPTSVSANCTQYTWLNRPA